MGDVIEFRPVKNEKEIFLEFVQRLIASLSHDFGPLYAKEAYSFGVPLVPFFEKKIVTIGYDERLHPWLMTVDGNIDVHLNGTMIISARENAASQIAEMARPEIDRYNELLRANDPEMVWLQVIVNQINADLAPRGDVC